jgi:hypothetical protein
MSAEEENKQIALSIFEALNTRDLTAFLEKGEPFRQRSPQHSVSTKGSAPCASQPVGPSSLKTALGSMVYGEIAGLEMLLHLGKLEQLPR